MRVFVVAEFSEDIKEYLFQVQKIIKEQSIAGNFTLKENFHLTLRFIGEVKTQELDKLKEVINQVAQSQQPFELSLNKLGQFPRKTKGIIWIGLEQSEMLQRLYFSVERELEVKGYTREQKAFVPHITIGREVVLAKKFDQLEQQINIEKIKIPVRKITLMESTRLNGKLTYIPLYSKVF